MNSILEHFTVSTLFGILLVFSRIGSVIMILPAIGDNYVSFRIRLLFSLFFSLLIFPIISDKIPFMPENPWQLLVIVGNEIIIGIFLGTIIKILISSMHTAGMIIASQSALGSALLFDPSQGTQGAIIGNLISSLAIVLMFATDLYITIFQGIAESYEFFAIGELPLVGDLGEAIVTTVKNSFIVAIKISAPIIIVGVLIVIAGGILSRLMPGIQIFFIMVPVQLLISFFIITLILTGSMMWFTNNINDNLANFLLGNIFN